MSTCAECAHAELQCPPVVKCNNTNTFLYLDSPACEDFEPVEEDEEKKASKPQ